MEDRDYTRLIPSEPPKGLLNWMKGAGVWTKNWLVYKADWIRDPLTDLKHRCIRAHCTACGEDMILNYRTPRYNGETPCFGWMTEDDPVQWREAKCYDHIPCPTCGAEVEAVHTSRCRVEGYTAQYLWVMSLDRVQAEDAGERRGEGAAPYAGTGDDTSSAPAGHLPLQGKAAGVRAKDRLVLLFWRAYRGVNREGEIGLKAEPYEAYVAEEKKIIRLSRWGRSFYTTYLHSWWTQNKNFRDVIRDIEICYAPEGIDAALRGTVAENSKLDLYLREGALIGPMDAGMGDDTSSAPAGHLPLQGKAAGERVADSRPYEAQMMERRGEGAAPYAGSELQAAEGVGPTAGEREKTPVFPVAYLRAWQKLPAIETLLTTGAGKLLAELILEEKLEPQNNWSGWSNQKYNNYIPKLAGLDRHAKRPGALLWMDRAQYRAFLEHGAGAKEIAGWMLARKHGAAIRIPEDLEAVRSLERKDLELLAKHGANYTLALRYLTGQKRRRPAEKDLLTVRELCDYWDLAAANGTDLGDHDARWPQHLLTAHDGALVRSQFKTDAELVPKFARRYQTLRRYSWEKDGILIRPPRTENELVVEGKVLHHCVATYAKRHALGDTAILFVRRAEEPEMPWYTLQLDEKTGTVLQNRGRGNCKRTPEVEAFEKAWLKWVKGGCKPDKKKEAKTA